MHRLSGEDAGFLALESERQPMNGMVLSLLRPPGDGAEERPLTLEGLRSHIAQRLGDLAPLRWRVVPVPFGLNHPVYIEDPDFDIDRHLDHVVLPSPGDQEDLNRLCAEAAGRLLDRSRPLWHVTLVDGLAGGRQAVLLNTHHCLMDGRAGLVLIAAFCSPPDQIQVSAEDWHPDRPPRPWRLVLHGVRDYARTLRGFPRFYRRFSKGAAEAARLRAQGPIRVPKAGHDTPYCVLNNTSSNRRRYARAELSLDDVKRVKNVAGVTVNDVVLAVVSEALRRYLDARHALPERPLVAAVIVGVESADSPARRSGNKISSLTTSLCTDVDDIWERLLRIHEVTAAAKGLFEAIGPTIVTDGLEFVPPWVAKLALRRFGRSRAKNPERVGQNVTVSNYPGFPSTLSFGRFVVEDAYVSGPPNGSVGVNVSIWSYGDRLMVTTVAFCDAMDAPEEFSDHVRAATTDLLARARAEQGRAAVRATGSSPTALRP